MKKTYTKPATDVIKVDAAHLMAGSEIPSGGETNQNLSRDNASDLWEE